MKRLGQERNLLLWIIIISLNVLVAFPVSNLLAQEQEDVLIRALKDELKRSVDDLQLKDLEKPYYVEYAVEDTTTFVIEAKFGATVKSNKNRSRLLRVSLRVGNYDFDNSGFMGISSPYSMISRPQELVLEDDYTALRHDIWLATDGAYKQALEQLAEKRSFIKTKIQPEEIPDFSREEATTFIGPKVKAEFDQKGWEETISRLSSIFRQFPAIYDSSVSMNVKFANRYLINSEGSRVRQPVTLVSLYSWAFTQASDGMMLRHFVPFCVVSVDQLPSEKEIADSIRDMAEELTALISAPVLEKYLGPVLMTGQAACELFAQVLVPHLSGDRSPLLEEERMAAMIGESKLANRLNRRILPNFFNVVDDPTQKTFNKKPLIGFYKVDDQGVLAGPLTLVEKGFLRTLLMSRRPRKEIPRSNGHGRAIEIGSANAQIGNLFVQMDGGKSIAELKKELIELCREQEMSFGLLVKTLDNPIITGGGTSYPSYMMGAGTQEEPLTRPILVYKVFAENGREELVRGMTVGELTVRMLREIVAAGKDYHVNNRLMSPGGIMRMFMPYAYVFGSVGTVGIPTSIIAPTVLFEELEFKKLSGPQQKPALLTHPFFK